LKSFARLALKQTTIVVGIPVQEYKAGLLCHNHWRHSALGIRALMLAAFYWQNIWA